MIASLEPFGLTTLTCGICYSIGVLVFDPADFRFHFVVLLVAVFLAHVALVSRRLIERRLVGDRIAAIIASMKVE